MDCQEDGQLVRAPRPWNARRWVSRYVHPGHGLPAGGSAGTGAQGHGLLGGGSSATCTQAMDSQEEGQQIRVPGHGLPREGSAGSSVRPWTVRRRVSRYPGHELPGGGSAGRCNQAMNCQEEGQQVQVLRPWTAKKRASRYVYLCTLV